MINWYFAAFFTLTNIGGPGGPAADADSACETNPSQAYAVQASTTAGILLRVVQLNCKTSETVVISQKADLTIVGIVPAQ